MTQVEQVTRETEGNSLTALVTSPDGELQVLMMMMMETMMMTSIDDGEDGDGDVVDNEEEATSPDGELQISLDHHQITLQYLFKRTEEDLNCVN